MHEQSCTTIREHIANTCEQLEEPVDGIALNQSEGPSAPGLGLGRPRFGLARDQGKRIEVALTLKQGGLVTVVEELGEPLSAEVVAEYGKQLAKDIAEGRPRTFTDSWGASGQHAWVNLGDVVAFSLRPAK